VTERKTTNGAGNLAAWNAQGHRYTEVEAAVEKFRADLEMQLGSGMTPAQRALSAAAVASYTGILLIQNRLLAARGRYSKVESLLGLLPRGWRKRRIDACAFRSKPCSTLTLKPCWRANAWRSSSTNTPRRALSLFAWWMIDGLGGEIGGLAPQARW